MQRNSQLATRHTRASINLVVLHVSLHVSLSTPCLTACITLQVRVLGEGFTPEDEEDSAAAEVSKVWAYQARYRVPLAKAVAGLPFSTNNSNVLLSKAQVVACSWVLALQLAHTTGC